MLQKRDQPPRFAIGCENCTMKVRKDKKERERDRQTHEEREGAQRDSPLTLMILSL